MPLVVPCRKRSLLLEKTHSACLRNLKLTFARPLVLSEPWKTKRNEPCVLLLHILLWQKNATLLSTTPALGCHPLVLPVAVTTFYTIICDTNPYNRVHNIKYCAQHRILLSSTKSDSRHLPLKWKVMSLRWTCSESLRFDRHCPHALCTGNLFWSNSHGKVSWSLPETAGILLAWNPCLSAPYPITKIDSCLSAPYPITKIDSYNFW